MVEYVRRAFEIEKRQDVRLAELSRKMPGMTKSMIMQIVVELGIDEFERSAMAEKLRGGAAQLLIDGLLESHGKSKKAMGAKRRS